MKMHEHDQEIIMAIAEGTLDDQAALDAVAACAECSADLELQRFAISALRDVPDAYLSATESATLHANLKHELSLTKPAPAEAKRGFAWGKWAPALGLAAVFLFFVALVPAMLGGGFGFGGDDSSDEVAMVETTAAASAETRAAAEAPASALDSEEMEMLQATDGDDMAGDATAGAAETTAAAAETTAAPTTESVREETTTTAAGDGGFLLTSLDLLGAVEELDLDALVDLIADDPETVITYSEDARLADPEFSSCLEETVVRADELGLPEDSEPIILGVASDEAGDQYVLVAYVPSDLDLTVFALHHPTDCDVVELLP